MQSLNKSVSDIESILGINQTVEMIFGHPDLLEEYEGVVEGLEDEIIPISMVTGVSVPEKTPCWVYTEYKGQHYGFETEVRDCEREEQNRVVLKRPREMMRLQRKRRYFRIPVDLLATFRISRHFKDDQEGSFSGTIRNISSGGVLLDSEAEIPLGSELLLVFTLPDEMNFEDLPAKVVRGGIVQKEKKQALYEYGVKFYDIHTELRRTIMRYVFNLRMELNREEGSP